MTESEAQKIGEEVANKFLGDFGRKKYLALVIRAAILLHQPHEPAKAKTRGEIVAEKAVILGPQGIEIHTKAMSCVSFDGDEVDCGGVRIAFASLIDSEIAREREECAKILDRCGVNLISASAGAEMIRARRD